MLDEQAAKLRTARTELMRALNDIKGIDAFDSAANFILFRIENASDVFACLKDKNILIKNLTPGPKKYDTKRVRAKVAKSKTSLTGGDVLWIRSESGLKASDPWYMEILDELSESIPGRPWENVLDAMNKPQ